MDAHVRARDGRGRLSRVGDVGRIQGLGAARALSWPRAAEERRFRPSASIPEFGLRLAGERRARVAQPSKIEGVLARFFRVFCPDEEGVFAVLDAATCAAARPAE